MTYLDIINFWFDEIEQPLWWKKDENFDQLIRDRFMPVHRQAAGGELFEWRKSELGRLAEVIILDQFSRNIFRGTESAFAFDGMALILAQEAVASGADIQLSPVHKSFLYMPYMHSESKFIHSLAVELYKQPGLESNYEFELKHKVIIDEFGRYPHRNCILGRESSAAELEFLMGPDSSF